ANEVGPGPNTAAFTPLWGCPSSSGMQPHHNHHNHPVRAGRSISPRRAMVSDPHMMLR
ncbi:MAG: hypothetical protein Q9212_007450, partial [Teloschistes hypoglaucus]